MDGAEPDESALLGPGRDTIAEPVASHRASQRERVRVVAVGVLVVVSWLALALVPVAVWARAQVMETSRWVAVAGPLAEEPAVRGALATWTTEQLVTLIRPERHLRDILPDLANALSAPLSGAVTDYVHEQVLEYLESPEFGELWVRAVAQAHDAALKVLEGKDANTRTRADSVTINLLPLIQQVLDQITTESPELLGGQVDIPDIDLDDVPQSSAQQLGRAVGVDVPEHFGQVTVYDRGRLRAAQDALRLVSRLVGLIVTVAVVAPIGAIALSRRRRSTSFQIVLGALIGLVLVRRALHVLVDLVLAKIPRPAAQGVVDRLLARLLDPLLAVTAWIVGGAAVVLVLLYLAGPRPRAVRIRHAVPDYSRRLVDLVRERSGSAQIVVLALGVVALWTLDLGWLAFVLLVAAVGAATWAVGQLPPRDRPHSEPEAS